MDSFYLPTPLLLHVSYLCSTLPLSHSVRINPRVTEEGVITQLGQSPNDLEDPSPWKKERGWRGLSYLAPVGEGEIEETGRVPTPLPQPLNTKQGNEEDPPSEIQHQPHHGGKRTVSGIPSLWRREWSESTYRQWLWRPPYRGLDAASAPGVGRGRRDGGTALSTSPWTPSPQQRRSSLSLAQVRGIWKRSGMESKETYFFFRSWEQRGQNHFPRGLVVSPTQAKWNHSMEQSGLSQPIISP